MAVIYFCIDQLGRIVIVKCMVFVGYWDTGRACDGDQILHRPPGGFAPDTQRMLQEVIFYQLSSDFTIE